MFVFVFQECFEKNFKIFLLFFLLQINIFDVFVFFFKFFKIYWDWVWPRSQTQGEYIKLGPASS